MAETLTFPSFALLILCGPSGSGKSTWAARHFSASQIVSTDACREAILDDAASQAANDDAFGLFLQTVGLRLKHRRFTVADSTALKPKVRDGLLALAREWKAPVYVVALDVPLDEALRRDAARPRRQVGERVVQLHRRQFENALIDWNREPGLSGLHVLRPETMERVAVQRLASPIEGSRFDVIGDVHGCKRELDLLLEKVRYVTGDDGLPRHPDGRLPVFVGDLADRGPDSPGVLRLACDLVAASLALFVPGNHDAKLFRLLRGAKVERTHGLELTERQLLALPDAERGRLTRDVLAFLEPARCHLILDGGRLVVAHAGITEEYIGRFDETVARFTRMGDVQGTDDDGHPIRGDWAADYAGSALIAYGHTVQDTVRFVHNTVNLDGGCVFGGALHALRYPEREIVSVPALEAYAPR